MNKKNLIICGALVLSVSARLGVCQQNLAPSTSATTLPQTVDSPTDLVAPFRIHPQTGQLLTAKGAEVADPAVNSIEKCRDRLLARWIIEHPDEYWKVTAPVFPPKGDPNDPPFDILRPHLYTAAMQARETVDQRKARDLATLAILNPIAYREELRKMNASSGN